MSISSPFEHRYYDESLRPPPEIGDAEDDERVSWHRGEALIDFFAYMIDQSNHTSASCPFTTIAGKPEELQVTFFLNPPPHISYFSVAYTSGKPTCFSHEPLILATEGNLVLISLKHATEVVFEPTDYNLFVYHAPTRGHKSPTLELLPQPKPGLFPRRKYCCLSQGDVGILRYRASSGSKQQNPFTPPTPTLLLTHALPRRSGSKQQNPFTPPTPTLLLTHGKPPFTPSSNNEEYDAYKIATLYARFKESELICYDLFIYDDMTKAWTCEHTTFSPQQPPLKFSSDKVITIDGTMVWVDLSQGMILCDLLAPPEEESTGGGPRQLRYIRLPKPLLPRASPIRVSNSSFYRDIAVVDDLIKFVDLEIHDSSPGRTSWTAVTWSMSVGDSEFHKDMEVKSADIAPSDALDVRSLFVAHPTLSSHHGDILYLMAKPSLALRDPESSVIALDMKNKKMERVAKFTTQRIGSMDFAYMLTTISKYLAPPGDSKASIRKRGPASVGGSSRRKVPAFTLKSGLFQMEEEDHIKKPPFMDDGGDNMDLE